QIRNQRDELAFTSLVVGRNPYRLVRITGQRKRISYFRLTLVSGISTVDEPRFFSCHGSVAEHFFDLRLQPLEESFGFVQFLVVQCREFPQQFFLAIREMLRSAHYCPDVQIASGTITVYAWHT